MTMRTEESDVALLYPLGVPMSGNHATPPALVRRAARAWPLRPFRTRRPPRSRSPLCAARAWRPHRAAPLAILPLCATLTRRPRPAAARAPESRPCCAFLMKGLDERESEVRVKGTSGWDYFHIFICFPLARIWARSLRWKVMAKSTIRWFIMRKKYYSDWKNKLNNTDYKTSEQDHRPHLQDGHR
jgi:hypothetical protein